MNEAVEMYDTITLHLATLSTLVLVLIVSATTLYYTVKRFSADVRATNALVEMACGVTKSQKDIVERHERMTDLLAVIANEQLRARHLEGKKNADA
jgi:hypothetical protein